MSAGRSTAGLGTPAAMARNEKARTVASSFASRSCSCSSRSLVSSLAPEKMSPILL